MFLKQDILEKIRKRAFRYDQKNIFPDADYNALKKSGYYTAFVPKAFGGAGLSLEEIAFEQTKLAMHAPATALGINMHQIIVGLGNYLVKHNHPKGELILNDAASEHLFGFGISEPSNDRVLFGSITKAVANKDGGYAFYGKKIFVSLAEKWSRLLTFGNEQINDDNQSVFAILKHEDQNFEIIKDWDTLGMRATQSHTIELNGATASADYILTKVAPGPTKDPVVFGIFGHFEILLAATYFGIGKRALDLGIEIVKERQSVASGKSYAQDKDIRWRIAEAAIRLDTVETQIRSLSRDFESEVDYGNFWYPKLSSLKNLATETTLRVVEEILRATGGRSYYAKHELSRLYRDALAGLFQPSDQESLHNAWASVLLGPLL